MDYKFSEDWTSNNIETWQKVLKGLVHKPNLRMLEIGVFEGRSVIWFLNNVLDHKTSTLTCIDTSYKDVFYENIRKFKNRTKIIQAKSQVALRDVYFSESIFDIIYIDGSHNAKDVLEDAILCFRTLKSGGILIFDDYLWKSDLNPLSSPQLAIDSFLHVFEGNYQLLHKGWQVIIMKIDSLED